MQDPHQEAMQNLIPEDVQDLVRKDVQDSHREAMQDLIPEDAQVLVRKDVQGPRREATRGQAPEDLQDPHRRTAQDLHPGAGWAAVQALTLFRVSSFRGHCLARDLAESDQVHGP